MSTTLTGGHDEFDTYHPWPGSTVAKVHPQLRDDVVAAISVAAALSGHCLALSSAFPEEEASTFQGLGL
jgi:hypothetical protein